MAKKPTRRVVELEEEAVERLPASARIGNGKPAKKPSHQRDEYDEALDEAEDAIAAASPSPAKTKASKAVKPAKERRGPEPVLGRTRTLADGKLTKRQADAAASHVSNPDSYWDAVCSSLAQQTGSKSRLVPISMEELAPVIPMPALCLEWLLGITGWPLGPIPVQLAGKESSCKSLFLLEIQRWCAEVGGGGDFYDHESKFKQRMLQLILEDNWRRITPFNCKNIEDWQNHLQRRIHFYQDTMMGNEKQPGPGKIFPIALGVDSVMGKSTEKSQQRVQKDGHGSRGYPEAATIITDYMKTIVNDLEDWPFTVVFVNHSKDSIPQNVNEKSRRTTPGSQQLRHTLGLDIEFKASKTQMVSAFEYVHVTLETKKNTMGPTHRKIRTRTRNWNDPEQLPDGKEVTHNFLRWDWAWAEIDFLVNSLEQARLAHCLKRADFHLQLTKKGVNYEVWSKTLGIPKTSPVEAVDAFDLLHKDTKLLQHLRAHLGIEEWPMLEGVAKYLARQKG